MNIRKSVLGSRSILGMAFAATLATAGLPLAANAALIFDGDVTPNVIFGSGNANGNFTINRNNGVELGLRAKIPFVGTTNSNGDGTYSYDVGTVWNFDWTINVNYDDSSLFDSLGLLNYQLGLDMDPGVGTNFFIFDPVNVPWADHSFGDNTTINGGGAEALDATAYSNLVSSSTVVQQSWRYEFFPFPYDPSVPGIYDITLQVASTTGVQAATRIQVRVGNVPEPATLVLMALGLVGLGFGKRRTRGAANTSR